MKNSRLTDGIWMNDDKTLAPRGTVWLITFPAVVALKPHSDVRLMSR